MRKFREMLAQGFQPSDDFLVYIFGELHGMGKTEEALSIFQQRRNGKEIPSTLYASILKILGSKKGNGYERNKLNVDTRTRLTLAPSDHLGQYMKSKEVKVYNSLIYTLGCFGRVEHMMRVFQYLCEKGPPPDEITYQHIVRYLKLWDNIELESM
jgi:pentatricopeptide repeat protein